MVCVYVSTTASSSADPRLEKVGQEKCCGARRNPRRGCGRGKALVELQVGPLQGSRPPACRLSRRLNCHVQVPASPSVTTMALELRRSAALFAAAAALRLLLFSAFPTLPSRLAGRVELSTPVSSFKRRMSPPPSPLYILPLTTPAHQCRRVSTYTPTMSLPTMAASTTRPRCCCRSSPSSPTLTSTRGLRTCSSSPSIS